MAQHSGFQLAIGIKNLKTAHGDSEIPLKRNLSQGNQEYMQKLIYRYVYNEVDIYLSNIYIIYI